jgi:hypothetical protein
MFQTNIYINGGMMLKHKTTHAGVEKTNPSSSPMAKQHKLRQMQSHVRNTFGARLFL